MDPRIDSLLGSDENVLVMPTQRSARHLIVEWCRQHKCSADASRVISFDSFSALFSPDTGSAKRADSIVRTVFANRFVKSRVRFFRLGGDGMPPEALASYIASVLPHLHGETVRFRDEGLQHDLMLTAAAYQDFMDRYGYYEESWLEKSAASFRGDRAKTWWLVWGGAEINMQRLLSAIGQCDFVRVLDVPQEKPLVLRRFDNERAELSAVFDRLDELRAEGVPLEDIIISSPDVDRLRPYLDSEAALRDIPLSYEKDADLRSTPVGRYLSAVGELASCDFDFRSLEALLLDRSLPYTGTVMDLNRRLLRRMCDNCIQSDSAHDLARRLCDRELSDHFRLIKSYVRSITTENDPDRLLAALQGLTSYLFGPQQLRGNEADREVYSFILDRYDSLRAVLSALDEPAPDIWRIFISALSSVSYVSQHRSAGIRVFRYTHDYQLYVPYRFVLALSDANSRAEEKDWPFLDDFEVSRRRTWEAGEALFAAYSNSADEVWLSTSRETWAGPAMAPFHFTRDGRVEDCGHNASSARFPRQARSLLASGGAFRALPDQLRLDGGLAHPLPVPENGFSYSAVSRYEKCPFAAAMEAAARIRSEEWSADDFDVRALGQLLHGVLELFLEENRKKPLVPALLDEYRDRISQLLSQQLEKAGFTGYMEEYVRANYQEGLEAFPGLMMEAFGSGLVPQGCEVTLSDGELNGRMDAVLADADSYILVDFKKKSAPSASRYQLLMYRKMLEAKEGKGSVSSDRLVYYLVRTDDGKPRLEPEVRPGSGGGADEERLKTLTSQMENAVRSAREGYLGGRWPLTPQRENCQRCDYAAVCRRRYYAK